MSLREYSSLAKNVLLRPLRVREPPRHIQIEVTTHCNLDCLSCCRRHVIENARHMDFELFKKIIDQTQPGHVNLSGLGEPLMHPRIFEMINYCSARGATVLFPTNLTVAPRLMRPLVESGINQVKVSIDAARRGTYLQVRRRDLFPRIVENLETINRVKRELGVKTPALRFNFALQQHNVDELPELIDLALTHDVSTVYVQWLMYDGVPDARDELVEGLSRARLSRVFDEVRRRAAGTALETTADMWQRDLDVLVRRMNSGTYQNDRMCYFPWVSSFVDIDGNLKPCPKFDSDRREGNLGNLHRASFEAIWNGPAYQGARMGFRCGQKGFSVCRECVPMTMMDARRVLMKLVLNRNDH